MLHIFLNSIGDYELNKNTWHFISFSYNNFESKGYFIVDEKVAFEIEDIHGDIKTGKGLPFSLENTQWTSGFIFDLKYISRVQCNLKYLRSI